MNSVIRAFPFSGGLGNRLGFGNLDVEVRKNVR